MSIEQISDILTKIGGFRRVPEPLHIAEFDFAFEFDAVLEGPGDQHGLVLISDVSRNSLPVIERRLRAFTLALSRTSSARTICLVLFGSQFGSSNSVLTEIESICRIVLVPTSSEPGFALRALLPINLPEPGQRVVTADEALAVELAKGPVDELMKQLQKSARVSADAVQLAMRKAIEDACTLSNRGEK